MKMFNTSEIQKRQKKTMETFCLTCLRLCHSNVMYEISYLFVLYLAHQSQFLSITCVRVFPSVLHNINTNSVRYFVVSDGVFEKGMNMNVYL